ncbi:MAG: hypothetical protein AAFR14_07290 [Bacteroidota bacterium]
MRTRSWYSDIIHTLYPDLCVSCEQQEPLLDLPYCLECREEISWILTGENAQAALIGKPYFPKDISSFDSLLYFTKKSRAQRLIQAIKYKGRRDVAQHLGALLGGRFAADQQYEHGTLVPVPLHPKRYRSRGYNQANQIAKGIQQSCSHLGRTPELLVRKVYESSQTKLSRMERSAVLRSSFGVNHEYVNPSDHAIIVDDVITTGSTIAACAAVLRESGYRRISILSVAISI